MNKKIKINTSNLSKITVQLTLNYFVYHNCDAVPNFFNFKLRRDHRKNFCERHAHESVDDGIPSKVESQKELKKRIHAL